MTFGKDRRTNDLALAILHEEVEHETWFSEYLQEDPSGHFRRGSPGTSPFVRRFMDFGSWPRAGIQHPVPMPFEKLALVTTRLWARPNSFVCRILP